MKMRLKSVHTEPRVRCRCNRGHSPLCTDGIDSPIDSHLGLILDFVSFREFARFLSSEHSRLFDSEVPHVGPSCHALKGTARKNYFFLHAIVVISLVNHICLLHNLNTPSSIFPDASCCTLDAVAEPCFLHVPSLSSSTSHKLSELCLTYH